MAQPPAALAAVKQAKQQWPRLAGWDVNLTTGSGPFMSETFSPEEPDNPTPGQWNIELRNPKTVANQGLWPEYVGLEGLHYLQTTDPQFQNLTEQFIASMTPEQHQRERARYQQQLSQALEEPGANKQRILSPESNLSSYDRWLRQVQALEYIRGGGMFPKSIGKQSDRGYTAAQSKLLGQITDYLKTPMPNGGDQSQQWGAPQIQQRARKATQIRELFQMPEWQQGNNDQRKQMIDYLGLSVDDVMRQAQPELTAAGPGPELQSDVSLGGMGGLNRLNRQLVARPLSNYLGALGEAARGTFGGSGQDRGAAFAQYPTSGALNPIAEFAAGTPEKTARTAAMLAAPAVASAALPAAVSSLPYGASYLVPAATRAAVPALAAGATGGIGEGLEALRQGDISGAGQRALAGAKRGAKTGGKAGAALEGARALATLGPGAVGTGAGWVSKAAKAALPYAASYYLLRDIFGGRKPQERDIAAALGTAGAAP